MTLVFCPNDCGYFADFCPKDLGYSHVSKRFGIGLSRSTCLNYLHRLGFVLKRPKKASGQGR